MKQEVILFVSRESATYRYVKSQVELHCGQAFGDDGYNLRVIDVINRPDLAEKHNIEALPTTVCDGKRFIGTPRPGMNNGFLGFVGGQRPPRVNDEDEVCR